MSDIKKIAKLPKLELDCFDIIVSKDSKLRPFINSFHFQSEHVDLQQGDLFGVIQVFDRSDHSAYLPNLIAQVIKKEFFADPKRSPEKSFESALHKANLALTDLAQHEIIQWIGKLHAVVGAVYENHFNFSQAGGGRILVIRNKTINDVSKGLDDGEGTEHPIKTFSNISSGTIEIGDKIIFATETVFKTIKWDEIKRHSTVFNSQEFDNIFRSTLELEGVQASAVVVNAIDEKRLPIVSANLAQEQTHEDVNFFGENKSAVTLATKEKNTKKPSKQNSAPLTNQSEEISLKTTSSQTPSVPEETRDNFLQKAELFIKETDTLAQGENFLQNEIRPTLSQKISVLYKKFQTFIQGQRLSALEKSKNYIKSISYHYSNSELKTFPKKSLACFSDISQKTFNQSQSKLAQIRFKKNYSLKFKKLFSKLTFLKIKKFFLCLPSFDKRNLESRLFVVKKASQSTLSPIVFSVFLLIALLLLLPYLFKKKTPKITQSTTQENLVEIKTDPWQAYQIKDLQTLASLPEEIKDVAVLKNNAYFLTNNENFYQYNEAENKITKIDLPAGQTNLSGITAMDSLKLIFFISQTQIFSYSPIVNRFYEDKIILPEKTRLASEDTYLTYLYLLDNQNNQIYQYPRAEGGFGPIKNWLKNADDLSGAIDITIDGSIYIAFSDGKIEKYFRGKKDETFKIQSKDIALIPFRIKTVNENSPLFILDNTHGLIAEVEKTGNVKNYYSSTELKDAKNFWLNWEENKIYFVTDKKEIKVFEVK